MSHMPSPIRLVSFPAFATRPARAPLDLARLRPSRPDVEAEGAGAALIDGLGDLLVIALGALPAAANAAIILTALGWRLV